MKPRTLSAKSVEFPAASAAPAPSLGELPQAMPVAGASIAGAADGEAPKAEAPVPPVRMLVWTATLELEVHSTTESLAQAVALAEKCGGYAESQTNGNGRSSASLRIPSSAFSSSISSFEKLGIVLSRGIDGKDVTDQYVDLDSRIKTMTELRDRMRALLTQAKEIKEILAIETELNRIQSDLDSMQARLKGMQGQVDFATVNLTFSLACYVKPPRTVIYGPLGYTVKSLGWLFEKMWIIRE
jgi:hypothetical protein